ncbi:DNA-processing protein DprA [Thalassobius sp. Cn5-15]|uniref:DNA-processing protein DprA n=1 Tax=Thalassobius sp. Cn5-15 TaxID=2917763 RepID=UPI001EF21337|nr:DNA-processing protein DprA [Thalassobius sp. Cn5-15]MCG7493163.1 DNA-processing protein DprA [Thalassobius sp. Cn5-15]
MIPMSPSNHSPPLPASEVDRVAWLRLIRSYRVGPTTFYRLMATHGSAQAALDALPEVAAKAGVKDYAPYDPDRALAELRAGHAIGARMLCHGAPDYPAELAEIPDAPPVLWALGRLDLLSQPKVGLVGARNASSLGTRMARHLAADLGQAGQVVVSGLARGIDAAAHRAAIDTGTIAVLAGGADIIYPAENTPLYSAICEQGLILSERPFGLQPKARDFPRRNRIISGLSRALVVVEAAYRSGSLITARTALDQGREVLSVPGHPLDARAGGCNALIRDGARLVRSGADVLEALPPPVTQEATATQTTLDLNEQPAQPSQPATEKRGLRDTAALHQQILSRLSPTPVAEDQLIRDVGASARHVAPILTDLEMTGRIKRQPGGLLSRMPDQGPDQGTS